MNIQQAIKCVDTLKPNQYDWNMKVRWLSLLDGQIFREVLQTHENCPVSDFVGYENADADTELLVPFPYDENIYIYWLQAQIDKENGEIAKYNQSITLYNNSFLSFQNWYNRTHMPISNGSRFRF